MWNNPPKSSPEISAKSTTFLFPRCGTLFFPMKIAMMGCQFRIWGGWDSVSGRLTDEATLVILSRDHSVIAVAKPLILVYGPFWRGFLARCIRELVSILDVNSPSLLCALPSCHLTMVPKFKRTWPTETHVDSCWCCEAHFAYTEIWLIVRKC